MSNKNKRPWCRGIANLGVIVAIVATVVAIIVWLLPNPPPPPDFSISVNPMRGEVLQGGVIQTTVTVMGIHGYEHPVSLSASGQPSGVVVTFIPPIGGPTPSYTSTVTINVQPSVLADVYTTIIKGMGADGKEYSCKYILSVISKPDGIPPDFSTSVNPMRGTVKQGGVISTAITVKGEHRYKESISLSASGQPSGVVVTFAPQIGEPATTFTSDVMINVDLDVPTDSYEIMIKGIGADGKEHSCKYILSVISNDNNDQEYAASKNSEVFHYIDCSYVKKIKPENLILFKTRKEAIASGRRPCKVCKP